MKLTLIQTEPKFGEIAQNKAHLASILSTLQSDVIVLPELCLSGYSFLNASEALDNSLTAAAFAAFLLPFSQSSKAVIVAGFAERYEEEVYNSAIFLCPDGNFKIYRKTHLFYKEKFCFSAGDTGFQVFKHPSLDAKIGVMICYDWRFPESARTLALQGADLIVCPSNLVTTVWDIGMRARALENAVFVATCNRVGTEVRTLEDGTHQSLRFTGKSTIYHPNGAVLALADENQPDLLNIEIDLHESRKKHFNEFNDIFEDRRPAFYKLD